MIYNLKYHKVEHGYQHILTIESEHYDACAIREVLDYGSGQVIGCRMWRCRKTKDAVPVMTELPSAPLASLARFTLFDVQMWERWLARHSKWYDKCYGEDAS